MKFPWAYPGAKVICIDDEFRSGWRPLQSGREYTIASVHNPPRTCPKGADYRGSALSVHLVGVGPFRIGFAIERFRPPTSEVEKLKELLKQPIKKKESLDA